MVIVVLHFGFMVGPGREGNIVLEVEETENGVFMVTMTDSSYKYLDKVSKECDIPCETILAFWFMNGQQAMTKIIEPD